MRVGSTYDQVVAVASHAPGEAVYLTFPTWDVRVPRGLYIVSCTTELAADMVPANDRQADTVAVEVGDAAVVAIFAPVDTILPGDVVPQAALRNYGTARMPVSVTFSIIGAAPPYQTTVSLSGLPPGMDTTVSFTAWNAKAGTYVARCSVHQAGDVVPSNDTASVAFTVWSVVTPGWVERRSMPLLPSSKQAKDGAWLAEAGDYVYAAKGNKTPDFYRYNVVTDSWQTLAAIPPGREDKVPGKGAVGAVGPYVYAVKGNNTLGFFRYDPDQDSWHQLADIPPGLTNKKVKGGSDIVFINNQGQDPDYLYLLKGGRNEFWRYDITGDSWKALPYAPLGTSGKDKYDKGSWLVERRLPQQGPRVIYCHKAKYHELFVFDTEADTWLSGQLTGMPFLGSTGKSKKSKDGGCGASLGDYIYALKGGNTQEFWQYDVALDSWYEAEPMPLLGSSGKSKKVKAGADIVSTRDCLYALKGNKTLEFWQYVPAPCALRPTLCARQGVQADVVRDASGVLRIFPNPLRTGVLKVSLSGGAASLPRLGVRVSLFDALGRAIRTWMPHSQHDRLSLDLEGLADGIYVMRVDMGDHVVTQKLVVQR
jgi:hypothetical protein